MQTTINIRGVYKLGIMDGNPKNEPMHYGEVIGSWAYIGANNGLVSAYEAFANHASDADLIKLLREAIKMMKTENKQLEKT